MFKSRTTKEKANRPIRIDGAPAIVWEITRSDAANFETDSAR